VSHPLPDLFAYACFLTGSLTDAQATRKHISSKIVVVILLCVILTTLAFLASTTWYLCRKDKCPIQSPTFLSDRETSCNSATNLISHRASSVSETKIRVDSPINPISGRCQLLFPHQSYQLSIACHDSSYKCFPFSQGVFARLLSCVGAKQRLYMEL